MLKLPKTKFLTYWFPHLTISVKLHSRTLRISSLVISWTRPYLQPHSSLKLINSSKNVLPFSHYLSFGITSSAMRIFFWNFIWFSNRVRESLSRQQSANRDARRASFIWKLSWASCIRWSQQWNMLSYLNSWWWFSAISMLVTFCWTSQKCHQHQCRRFSSDGFRCSACKS